jgi:hypothetical protein
MTLQELNVLIFYSRVVNYLFVLIRSDASGSVSSEDIIKHFQGLQLTDDLSRVEMRMAISKAFSTVHTFLQNAGSIDIFKNQN